MVEALQTSARDWTSIITKDFLKFNQQNWSYSPLNVQVTNCFDQIISKSNTVKNQAGVKLENQAVSYRFRWDFWAAATFGLLTRTTTRTETNLHFNLLDQNEILTIIGMNTHRPWETTDCKMSGQLNRQKMSRLNRSKQLMDLLMMWKETWLRTKQ